MKRTVSEQIADAEARSSMALARYNELTEAGKGSTAAADRALLAAQTWLDRANELRGQGSIR